MHTQSFDRRVCKIVLFVFGAVFLVGLVLLALPLSAIQAAPNAQAAFTVLKDVFNRPPGLPFNVGESITYTVHITNNSGSAVTGPTTVVDNVPGVLVFVSAEGGIVPGAYNCSNVGNLVTCVDNETIPNGAGLNLHVVVRARCGTGTAGIINSATFNAAYLPGGSAVATDPTAEFSTGSPPCVPAAQPTVKVSQPAEVPEADTLLLVAGGVGGLGVWLRWQYRKRRGK